MGKHDVMKMQTCVLKVNINCSCDGCIQRVKKVLQKMDEVYSVSIDANHGKVTVTGNHLDPSKLIQKLRKSGKHAELWGLQKSANNINNNNNMQNHFKNNNIMPQNNNNKSHKNGSAPPNFKQQQQQMKVAPKNKKSVTFDDSDDEFDDDDDDCFSGSDDEFDDDDEDDDEGFGRGHVNKQSANKKMAPMMMGKGQGHFGQNGMMMNGAGAMAMMMNASKNGGKKGKKDHDDIEIPISFKKSASGKKGGVEKCYHDEQGKDKNSVIKTGLGFFGFGKKSKKEKDYDKKGKKGGKNNSKGAKKAGGDEEEDWAHSKKSKNGRDGGGYRDIDVVNHSKGKSGKISAGNLNGGGPMGMGSMGNYPKAQMGGMPTPSGAGMMNNGYYQGNGYNNNSQQQQYMAMMNQQRMMMMNGNGNDMYQHHPMMYGRPQAPMAYGPPPPQADPITHLFNDENTESCSIM